MKMKFLLSSVRFRNAVPKNALLKTQIVSIT